MDHRKRFPACVEQVDDLYKLFICPVQIPSSRVCISPPSVNIGPTEGGLWPKHCFQLLLVASEYCAALQEFLTWSFPQEWEPLKAQVAGYAAQLISTSGPVPAPQPAPGQNDLRPLQAYAAWATFTHCYFSGTGHLRPEKEQEKESRDAVRWLQRLVGEQGWQSQGPVHAAAACWVRNMRESLQRLFPGMDTLSAAEWSGTPYGGMKRGIEARTVSQKKEVVPYVPVYPYRVNGNFGQNRIKFTVRGHQGPRDISEVNGKCGVPPGYGQTHNCALGFLVLADVMQAFFEASKGWDNMHAEVVKDVVTSFFNGVLRSDEASIRAEHLPYSYPAYLAACALGWDLALQHVDLWVKAAQETAANVLGAGAGAGAPHPRLLLPRLMPLLPDAGIGALLHPRPAAHGQQQQQQQHVLQQPGDQIAHHPALQQPGVEAPSSWQMPPIPVAQYEQQEYHNLQHPQHPQHPQHQQYQQQWYQQHQQSQTQPHGHLPFSPPPPSPLLQPGLPPVLNAPAVGAVPALPDPSVPPHSPQLPGGLQLPGTLMLPPSLGPGGPRALPVPFSSSNSGSASKSVFAIMQSGSATGSAGTAPQHPALRPPLPLNELQRQHHHPHPARTDPQAAWIPPPVGPLGVSTNHAPPGGVLLRSFAVAAGPEQTHLAELQMPSASPLPRPLPLPGQQPPPQQQPALQAQLATDGGSDTRTGAGLSAEDVLNSISNMSLDALIGIGDGSLATAQDTGAAGAAAGGDPAGAPGGSGGGGGNTAGGLKDATASSPYQAHAHVGAAIGEPQPGFSHSPLQGPGLHLPFSPTAAQQRTITTSLPAPCPRHSGPQSPELPAMAAGVAPSQRRSAPPSPPPASPPPANLPPPPAPAGAAPATGVLTAAAVAVAQLQRIHNQLREALLLPAGGSDADLHARRRVERLHQDLEAALRRFGSGAPSLLGLVPGAFGAATSALAPAHPYAVHRSVAVEGAGATALGMAVPAEAANPQGGHTKEAEAGARGGVEWQGIGGVAVKVEATSQNAPAGPHLAAGMGPGERLDGVGGAVGRAAGEAVGVEGTRDDSLILALAAFEADGSNMSWIAMGSGSIP